MTREILTNRKDLLKLGLYIVGAGAVIYGGAKVVDFFTPRYIVNGNWSGPPKFKVYYPRELGLPRAPTQR